MNSNKSCLIINYYYKTVFITINYYNKNYFIINSNK